MSWKDSQNNHIEYQVNPENNVQCQTEYGN